MAATTGSPTPATMAIPADIQGWIDNTMTLTTYAVDLTGQTTEPTEDTLAALREVRSACQVLLQALQQVSMMTPGGFNPVPPIP